MGALKAYVHVRLCCSLRHHGRHTHHSLPRRNRQIYGCTLPAGTKMVRGGVGGLKGDGGRMRKYQWRRPSRESARQNREIRTRSEIVTLKMKGSTEMRFYWTRGKLKGWIEETSTARPIRQTGRRSFQPSTHQRSRLFRCLLGVNGRQTDCSQ